MSRLQLKPILTWSYCYPGRPLPEEPLKYFKDFSLDGIVQVLIWVKNNLEMPGKYDDLVHSLIRRMNDEKRIYLETKLRRSQVSHPIVIDKILVDLFRSHSLKSSTRDVDELGFEDQLFDLLLCYNDQHYESHCPPLEGGSIEAMWSLSLAQASTGFDNVDYARTANIKHLIFLKFLKQYFGDDFKSIEASFKQRTSLGSFHEVMTTLIQFYLTTETGEAKDMVMPNMAVEHCLILEKLSMVVDQISLPDPTFSIGRLAGQPYYKSQDRIYVTSRSNFAFALEKSWPYFLYQNSDLRNFLPGKKSFSDFQSLLGKNYVEDYFLNTLFSSLSKSGFRWIRPTETYMPDGCYIINESTVILFEFKSSPLHYNIIAEQDLKGLKKFLNENFATGKKGASQLANAVRHLSANSNKVYGIKSTVNKLTIYPVIIYTDKNLCMLGVNDYIDHNFQSTLGENGKPFKKVMPLTMVHADFFTENLLLLEKDRYLFKMALDHYLKYRRKKLTVYAKTGSPSDYLSAQYQFDRYILGYKQLYSVPQINIFKNLVDVFMLK